MANEAGTYQLNILLKAADQMSGVLGKGITSLKKFGAESRNALKDYEALRKSIAKPLSTSNLDNLSKKYKSVTNDTRAFGKEQDNLNKRFNRPISTAGLDAQLAKLREYRRELKATAKESDNLRSSMRAPLPAGPAMPGGSSSRSTRKQTKGGFLNRVSEVGDSYMGVVQLGQAWKGAVTSLDTYTDAAERLIRAQSQFQAINLKPEETAKGYAAVEQIVKQIREVNLTEATKGLTDLHTATGNLEDSLKLLPVMMKYRSSMKVMMGDQFNDEQIETNIQNAAKFLEVTGAISKGQDAILSRFNTMVQMGTATGGRLTPEMMLLAARRAGPSMSSLSEQGLRHLAMPLQELGPERTGTSLMSLYQALVGGVMKERAAGEFVRLGLVNRGDVQMTKVGAHIKPGGNVLGDALLEDPYKAALKLKEAMAAHGINTSDKKQVQIELALLFQNRMAQNMMEKFLNQPQLVEKEYNLAIKSEGSEDLYKRLHNTPISVFQQDKAAMEDVRAKVGESLLNVAAKIGANLLPVLQWLADNPNFAAGLIIAKTVLPLIAEGAALLKMSGLTDYLSKTETSAAAAGRALGEVESRATRLGSLTGKAIKFGAVATLLTIDTILAEKLLATKAEVKEMETKHEQGQVDTLKWLQNKMPIPKEWTAPKPSEQPQSSGQPKSARELLAAPMNIFERMGYRAYQKQKGTVRTSEEEENLQTFHDPIAQRAVRRNYNDPQLINQATQYPAFFWKLQAEEAWTSFYASYKFGQPFAKANIYFPGSSEGNIKEGLGKEKTLGHAGVMAEFRQVLREDEQAGGLKGLKGGAAYIEQMLESLYPQSFTESTALIKSGKLKLLTPPGEAVPTTKTWAMSKLAEVTTPAKDASTALAQIVPPARDLPGALQQDVGAALNFSSQVNNLKLSLPGDGGGQHQSVFSSWFKVPSRATGGIVERGGFAHVHDREAIVPARITRAWRDTPALNGSSLSPALMHSARAGVSYGDFHFTFNVPVGSAAANDPKAFASEVRAVVEEVLENSFTDHLYNNSDELDRIMALRMSDERSRA